jgi:AcrR family transcriptional regulator
MIDQGHVVEAEATPRERILATAYELFSRHGIRDVGIDQIVSRSGVARATVYRHFRSKDDLALAFLDRREQYWTFAAIGAEARRRGSTPEDRLLAIFEVFDDWFHCDDFEACSFINVLLEMGPDHRLGEASIRYLKNIRLMIEGLAADAGLDDPLGFAKSWHILMKGSIISAAEGDADAARRAAAMARALIAEHRR